MLLLQYHNDDRAKNVKNKAIINKDVSQKALLSAYQEEIKRLKEQLEKGGGVGGTGGLSIDEEKLKREKVMSHIQYITDQCNHVWACRMRSFQSL